MEDRISGLSVGQRKCLRLVAKGKTSKEIAIETGFSPFTVNKYIENAVAALGAANRREAAQLFAERERVGQYEQILYDPQPVASALNSANFQTSTETRGWLDALRSWIASLLLLPPLGGRENDLNASQRTIEIFRIAIIATAAVIGLVMLIAGALKTFS